MAGGRIRRMLRSPFASGSRVLAVLVVIGPASVGCAGSCASLQLTARPYFHAGPDIAGQQQLGLEAVVNDISGHPMAGVSVEFFIETDDLGSAVTGADGVARHQVELTQTHIGPIRHWSAQVRQSACVSTDIASYTNEP